MTSGGQTIAVPNYSTCTSPTNCAQITTFLDAFVTANGCGMQSAIYFGAVFLSGDTYVYFVAFANGQSITGSLIAQ